MTNILPLGNNDIKCGFRISVHSTCNNNRYLVTMKNTQTLLVLLYMITSCFPGIIKRQIPGELNSDCKLSDEHFGKCVPIMSCEHIINFIQNQKSIANSDAIALRKYRCNNSNTNDIVICCPCDTIAIGDKYIEANDCNTDHSKHKNAHLLPNICGESSIENKIINGNETQLYEFPWMAALKLKKENVVDYHCGGSLINNRYILTAAHCVQDKIIELLGVRLGEHNFATNIDCEIYGAGMEFCAPPYQDFDVSASDTIVHPEFNPETMQNDIALIRLRNEVDTSFLVPICLPIATAEKLNKISTYTVIGWGATDSKRRSNILLKGQVPAQDNAKCSNRNPHVKQLTNRQLCAGGVNTTDACNGDSGSSLMADYVNNDIFKIIQYGIVSFGPTICGKENFPTTYIKTAAYMNWILDNLKP